MSSPNDRLPVLFVVFHSFLRTTNHFQTHTISGAIVCELNQYDLSRQTGLYLDRHNNSLIRYDNYDIQEFLHNYKKPTQLTSNEVISFAEDADYFWVGTENRINLIDKTSYHIKRMPMKEYQTNR